MDYRLENLSEDDFELLVNMLCQKVLGTGTVAFTKGRDGGRDGRFIGTANNYPSSPKPWSGKFIIQAKHTTNYQASCSDNPFFGNKTSIINGEIANIKALTENGEVDNYLIFTNRKETESREKAIQYIKAETDLKNVDIIGKDTIHSWLRQYDDIAKTFKLGLYALPFEFYDKDIREVIIIFHHTLPKLEYNASQEIERPPIDVKNQINSLDSAYYNNVLLGDLNLYEKQILDFLQNPINETFAQYYNETSIELKRIIEINREQFGDFKQIFGFLTKYLTEKEPEKLKKYRNTIPAFFHFMYYNCDIGRNK
ncbi:MAG: hypothetical protein EAZ70_00015 [Runella slithyformis]|jgi:hypothetical protein|nr:MAG: hypothetical protein EAY79_00405 [Runella slithyformis]TAF29934.1 MAG: hypothetical protein EAZ70_00015 [Runella slithyformis]TAF49050.1 MAG: hypothetical protein EAZ63_02080 [Runella slithyformis]TAF79972.1 MAG: hypothetical protein EAZ50_09920 [Runella slithyformis]TAH16377.1 MAG: hypothetical protein EAZ14_00630 [Runella slithyformis]